MTDHKQSRTFLGICLVLAVATFLVYLPTTQHGFVNLDDGEYIFENPHVIPGLTTTGVAWAMTSGYASNWHPLTWITHMLDCQLYGLNPGGHHLTNILLHTAATLLLFLLLQKMTGAVWRSALVAALFAWHPLHVESVAWASERKDVLSAVFWLLTMMAYVNYADESATQGPRRKTWYIISLVFFALGLMSKPMLVTLPFVLLLVDFWPLKRRLGPSAGDEQPPLLAFPWRRLVVEKIPFFAMTVGASAVTFLVQRSAGTVSSLDFLPLHMRVINAVMAYLRYMGHTFWPVDLAAFYPYERSHDLVIVILAVALLAGVSALSVWSARRRPWLLTGWFWFLGTLVPTIGIVQVGAQSMADRYMYIPSIGFFVVVVWGFWELLSRVPQRRAVSVLTGSAALVACLLFTWAQVKHWRDSETLFGHAIAVTRDNYVAYNGLGGALKERGQTNEAMALFMKSVEIKPYYPEGRYNAGTWLLDRGLVDESIGHFRTALESNPDYAPAHMNLGKALLMQGKQDEAATHLVRAVKLRPENAQARYNLGTLLLRQSKVTEAIAEFSRAVRIKPDYAEAHGNLGIARMHQGKTTEGMASFAEALRLAPTDPMSHANMGVALFQQGKLAEAATRFSDVLRLNPNDAGAHFNLGLISARQRAPREAIAHYREAVRLRPDLVEALNNLAWILSTSPDAGLRNGREALEFGQKACQLGENRQAAHVLTLAACHAEAGEFRQAAAAAAKARELALAANQPELAAKTERLAKLFESDQPYRESE